MFMPGAEPFSVCVYCASSSKVDDCFKSAARELGRLLARAGMRVVFGAGKCGLMGELACGASECGGETVGVIPQFMYDEGWGNDALTRLEITSSMHERKERMLSLADAVVALPGGCGTLEELLEAITWKQLGLFDKPIVILNVAGYYDDILRMFSRAVEERFMRDEHCGMWRVAASPEQAVSLVKSIPAWRSDARKIAAI